jgi:hypothetical protein
MGLPDGPSNPAQGQNTGGWVLTGGKTVVREQPDGKRLLGPFLFLRLAIGEEASLLKPRRLVRRSATTITQTHERCR